MNETNIKSVLLSKTRLQKLFKKEKLTSKEVHRILKNLSAVQSRLEEEERQSINAKAEKQAAIARFLQTIQESGISVNDLVEGNIVKKIRKPRKSSPMPTTPKYVFTDEHGETHRWFGRGRVPSVFKDLLEKGVTQEELEKGSLTQADLDKPQASKAKAKANAKVEPDAAPKSEPATEAVPTSVLYQLTDTSGNLVIWKGKGRMPKAFKEKIDAGASLSDFAVNA